MPTKRAADFWESARFQAFSGFEFFLLPNRIHARLVVELVVEPIETLPKHTGRYPAENALTKRQDRRDRPQTVRQKITSYRL